MRKVTIGPLAHTFQGRLILSAKHCPFTKHLITPHGQAECCLSGVRFATASGSENSASCSGLDSGVLGAALVGAWYVPQVGIVNPSLLNPSLSLEIAVWVAIGGRGGLFGAILDLPNAWSFLMIAMLVSRPFLR